MIEQAGDLIYEVSSEEAGERLDVVLASLVGISRSQAKRWIEQSHVFRNGQEASPSERLSLGDDIRVRKPKLVTSTLQPESIPLDILFEDSDLLVLNKPAGLVVHPAPGHSRGTLVHALLHHCTDLSGIGGVERPGIVHRLDRGTSGVMVVAKTDSAHIRLSDQFRSHDIERRYDSLVRNFSSALAGKIETRIGRHPKDRKRMSTKTRGGRIAVTKWKVRERFPKTGGALLEVKPETGRTHQIRVHLASVGMPIAGDSVYGGTRGSRGTPWESLSRPALHASVLGFCHPSRGSDLRFDIPPPEDFCRVLETCRLDEQRRPSAE